MSRERRTVRPYTVDSALASTLNEATVWLDDLCCVAGSSLTVEDGSFIRSEVRVVWAVEDEFDRFRRQLTDAAWATGVHPQWLRLVVVARTGSLKLAETLLDCQLDGLDGLDRSVRLDAHPNGGRRSVFCADSHGTVVDAYVALSPDWTAASPAERRLPKRANSWLARATFRLHAKSAAAMFHPRPLDDAKRVELGLPLDTLRYIDLRGVDVQEAIDGTPDVDVWVDEDVLAALRASNTSAAALYFQRQLVLDFVSAVAFEYAQGVGASSDAAAAYDDLKDSLIGKVVQLTAEPDDEARDRMLRQCRREPARLVARAEHVLLLRDGVNKSLRAAS